MIFVQLESPLAGPDDQTRRLNLEYAVRCLKNALLRGEAPFAGHLLYPLCLDDLKPAERAAGILAGFAVMERTDLTAAYIDRGISPGMRLGIAEAERLGHRVVYRTERFPDADFGSWAQISIALGKS